MTTAPMRICGAAEPQPNGDGICQQPADFRLFDHDGHRSWALCKEHRLELMDALQAKDEETLAYYWPMARPWAGDEAPGY